MAGGSKLKYGEYTVERLSQSDMYDVINSILSPTASRSSSYKFIFFKALLDNFNNVDSNYSLRFNQVFTRFAEISWQLILRYKFRQGPVRKDYVKNGLEKTMEKFEYAYKRDGGFEGELKNSVAIEVKKVCSKYVIGALFEDALKRLYSFSKDTEIITFNPVMHAYLLRNRDVIEKLLYLEWGKYLYNTNEDHFIFCILGDMWYQKYKFRPNNEYIGSLIINLACKCGANQTITMTEAIASKKPIVGKQVVKKRFDENDMDLLDDPDKIMDILRQRRKILI